MLVPFFRLLFRGKRMVPEALAQLFLYRVDRDLCRRWGDLSSAWSMAFPGVDIEREVARAHAWEVSNPGRVRRARSAFLYSWLERASARREHDALLRTEEERREHVLRRRSEETLLELAMARAEAEPPPDDMLARYVALKARFGGAPDA